MGLRADLGSQRALLRQAPVHPRRRAAEPPVPQPEGRDDLRPRGQDRDRARRGCRAADRGGGLCIPHPARDDPPVAGARGRARARGLDARARRRGAVGRPLRPRRHVSSSPIPPTSAEQQYRDDSNLRARIDLHERFTTATEPWHRWVFDRIDLPPEARILEIGCGPAELWAQNLDRIPAGWELTLADLSPGMVEKAREVLGRPRRLSRGRHPGPSVRGRVVRRRRREPHALPRPRPAAGTRGDPTRARPGGPGLRHHQRRRPSPGDQGVLRAPGEHRVQDRGRGRRAGRVLRRTSSSIAIRAGSR